MASLLTIPLELLVSISSHLPTSDLAALRLTCKQIEKSLYEWFSKEFFTKKQFMLTHASIQALVDISKHVSFSKKLTHVIVASNVYDEVPLRFRASEAATRYIQGYEDQTALLTTGTDREMLTEAFSNLVNLETVGIRDFNSPSRVRDGDRATWSSWGATTVYHETGVSLQFSDRGVSMHQAGSRFISRVFSTVLYSLGKANSRPSQIEVLLREHGLPDTAFILPPFHHTTTGSVLQNVKTMLLNVDLSTRFFHTYSSGTPADPHAGRSLRRFLGYTPNLVHLRLNFQKHLFAYNEDFLEWLGTPVPTPGSQPESFLDPASIALHSLKQLDFGQLSVRADILLAIVSKFAPTLEGMSFWRMALRLHVAPPHGHKPNLWADFFTNLSKIPQLQLKTLKVGMIQQDHMHVNFEEGDNVPMGKEKEYTGKEMGKFLEDLSEKVYVHWPKDIPQLDQNSNADSDEEMADEDNEDEERDEEEEEEGEEEE
ncbi:hypothetical protein BKA66DRAFT_449990 [Pyrenochaeta sp. MPI-SDFR-AT-0127]|nr:hypothetical protein BKA66DRAFT_449990 [Pyrenochaeta sp. MPI-SDFR-AT-0127]